MEQEAHTQAETIIIAEQVAETLKGGDVVTLSGDLGAGKTTFVQMIARIYGITKPVKSPTFVFLRTYTLPKMKKGIKTLCHIDAYRLNSGKDLIDVGIEEYLGDKKTICFIEWPEHVPDIISSDAIHIQIDTEGEKRIFTIKK